ncbi:hypothetical protein RB195_009584 [Necator americanus]|uniref:Uncharacterized protein n=1 Tax=Necator americanus TaxID=51031 RepID=A0ABR1CTY3_NECAM
MQIDQTHCLGRVSVHSAGRPGKKCRTILELGPSKSTSPAIRLGLEPGLESTSPAIRPGLEPGLDSTRPAVRLGIEPHREFLSKNLRPQPYALHSADRQLLWMPIQPKTRSFIEVEHGEENKSEHIHIKKVSSQLRDTDPRRDPRSSPFTEKRHGRSERRRMRNEISPTCVYSSLMPRKKFAFASAETRSSYSSVCVVGSTGDVNLEKRLRTKLRRQLQQDRDYEWTSRAK